MIREMKNGVSSLNAFIVTLKSLVLPVSQKNQNNDDHIENRTTNYSDPFVSDGYSSLFRQQVLIIDITMFPAPKVFDQLGEEGTNQPFFLSGIFFFHQFFPAMRTMINHIFQILNGSDSLSLEDKDNGKW
jgi:hypothetical protein